ncbi:unnamed protein product [Chondrus crispus]|uniref:Uncharacterized protein n=1 Tax=Chondrus crispus TaxID=2769 RepID=R7Q6I5_CHOCR|nr:unnamed protein product [Chondrus crispus]CDF33639.1 unnamed protein product [Chondrus crispus]|eukprot:XP_005713458.1 unnamed protein product [Chondrus crispus]
MTRHLQRSITKHMHCFNPFAVTASCRMSCSRLAMILIQTHWRVAVRFKSNSVHARAHRQRGGPPFPARAKHQEHPLSGRHQHGSPAEGEEKCEEIAATYEKAVGEIRYIADSTPPT